MRQKNIRFNLLNKLIIATLIPMLVLLGAVILIVRNVNVSSKDFVTETQSITPLTLSTEQTLRMFYRWDDDLNMAVLAQLEHKNTLIAPQIADALKAEQRTYTYLQSAKNLGLPSNDYQRLRSELNVYKHYSEIVIRALHTNQVHVASTTQLVINDPITNTITNDLNQVKNRYMSQYHQTNIALHKELFAQRDTMYATFVAVLFISLAAAFFTSRRMARQVQALIRSLEQVAIGDRNFEQISNSSNDEFGDAFLALRHTVEMLHKAETLLQEQIDFRKSLLDAVPVPVFYKDVNGNFLEVNKAFEEFHGYTENELHNKTVFDLGPPENADIHVYYDKTIIENAGKFVYEATAYDAHGDAHSVIFYKKAFFKSKDQIDGIIGALIDISDRIKAEKHIQFLNQIYSALAQTNQTIVRCNEESTLFHEICRIAVEFGGMTLAWIGVPDANHDLILPVASNGRVVSMAGLEFTMREDKPEGNGLAGPVLRTGEPVIIQSYTEDPRTLPWKEQVHQFGLEAAASFPIFRADKAYAALTVFHTEKHVFDDRMIALLSEMCTDISFALDQIDLETSRTMTEQALRKTERRWKDIVNFLPDATFVIDKDSRVIAWNHAMELMTGVSENDMLGKNNLEYSLPFYGEPQPILINLALDFDHEHAIKYDNLRIKGDVLSGETIAPLLPSGQTYLSTTASVLRDPEGNMIGAIESIRDITEWKMVEEQVQQLAHYDALTGLPNRLLLADRTSQLISWAKLNQETFSLLFLDLDHFKNINDTLGHRVGDLLLIEVANRINDLLRVQDTASRLGGDEFILLLPDIEDDDVAYLSQKLIQVIATPYHIEEHDLTITPSIGIAVYPIDGDNWETLYKRADIAMYRAKKDGRNTYCFFTEEMQQHTERRLQLESALRVALEKSELILYYQPFVTLKTDQIQGMEALLRWQHPTLGMISPTEFIPVAEDSGLIIPIGEWVLRKAIQQMKQWLDAGSSLQSMAINLSALQLKQFNLPQLILNILEEEGLPPKYLELEITESVAMKEPERAIRIMDVLHQHGVKLSIDDFGTGYSSLAYLNRFPIDKLKIDQSFIRGIGVARDHEAIIKAVIGMAKSLRLHTIAEGVEHEREVQFLRRQRCDEIQGYYYCQPLPAGELADWLKQRT